MEGLVPDCDSDSSGSLPELFSKRTFDVAKLLKDEIVWAAYKNLHWPALVRDVDKKSKKVRVWYLDSPGKCFKVPFKKIHDFADADFNKKVEDDAKSHPLGKKHAQVLRRTLMFMHRKFQGYVDNPLNFFDTSKLYFVPKELNLGNSEIIFNSESVSTEKVCDKNEILVVSSEGESDVESATTTKYLPELNEEDCPYDDEMVDKILSCITSGHTDDYLMNVVNSKITNERHNLYVEAMKKDKIEQFWISQPLMTIKNHKLTNVFVHLNSLYEQKVGKENPRMKKYITSVWLPEAVDKAISLIKAESLKLTDDFCGNNKSSSPLEGEASDMIVDSVSDKFSSSPVLEESSEILVDSESDKVSSPLQVEASESSVNASSSKVFSAPERKLDSSSTVVKNSNVLEIEACTSNKKKVTSRKKKRQSKALRSGKNMNKLREENFSKRFRK